MKSWSYGLVEHEIEIDGEVEKQLVLCEVYFNKDKSPEAYCYVDWADIQKEEEDYVKKGDTLKYILKDIKDQIETEHYFKLDKKGRIKK